MSAVRYLVTGATGFVGRWVLDAAASDGDSVVWATGAEPDPGDLRADGYRTVDFEDADAVSELVREARPTRVVHLASLIAGSDLERLLRVNAVGTENLYGALAALAEPELRIVQVGSAAMYGTVGEDELPIKEDQPFRPVTPYAVSKVAQEYVAMASGLSDGLSIVRARIFNLLGPGQPEHLVPATFVRQLRAVARGESDSLRVGWTEARRDFVDVRDAVSALLVLGERGVPGRAYNVASGRDVSIAEVIDELMRVSGVAAPVEVEERRLRSVDVPRVVADVSLIESDAGWRATTTLGESLRDTWERAVTE